LEGQSTVPETLVNPSAVSAGWGHTCALDDGGVKCWGGNYYGQSTVPGLVNPSAVSAGWGHTCALDDGGVKCWGYDGYGQSTVPGLEFSPTAVPSYPFALPLLILLAGTRVLKHRRR
jgi:hypothetical protein